MASPPKGVPTQDELVTIADAAISNAAELLADAQLLAAAGRYPRAHALATLACEELGKSDQCLRAVWIPPAPRAFWEQFGSHTGKLSHAESAALVGSGQVISSAAVFNGRVHEASRTSHNRKLRGLYVDYADGLVLVPTAIDNATAQRRIELAETLVDRARQGFSARVEQVKWWANKSIALRVVWVIFLTWATENQLGDVMQMLATGRSDGLMELFPRFAAYVEPTGDLTTFLNNYARATDS